MKSFSNSPRLKAAIKSSCSSNTIAGASIIKFSSATAAVFITDRPILPVKILIPPLFEKGLDAGRTIVSFKLSFGPSVQTNSWLLIFGSWV